MQSWSISRLLTSTRYLRCRMIQICVTQPARIILASLVANATSRSCEIPPVGGNRRRPYHHLGSRLTRSLSRFRFQGATRYRSHRQRQVRSPPSPSSVNLSGHRRLHRRSRRCLDDPPLKSALKPSNDGQMTAPLPRPFNGAAHLV